MNMKRTHHFLAVAISFTSVLFSQPSDARRNSYPKQRHTQQQSMNQDERVGLDVFGDFLLWKPYFSNTPYALGGSRLNQAQPRPDGITGITYEPYLIDFNPGVGFRIGAAYSNDWNKISFSTSWTRFHAHQQEIDMNDRLVNQAESDLGNPVVIDPFWGANSTIPEGGTNFKLVSDQYIKIDQLDFVFATRMGLNKWLSIKPGAGIRAYLSTVSFKNRFTKNVRNFNRVFVPPFSGSTETVSQRYYSLGALLSLKNEFDVGHGLSIINDIDLSLLVGSCKNKSVLGRQGPSVLPGYDESTHYQTTLVENEPTIKPVFDFDLGFQYEYTNTPKTWGYYLQVAYEAHILPDFVEFILLRDTTSQVRMFTYIGDLAFQGMRARAGITF